MKCAFLIVASLFSLVVAGAGSTNESDSTASDDSAKRHVFELPQSAGSGEGKVVSVLLDADHVKLATVILRDGTLLPSHRVPVPATILVLEGEGVIHLGDDAVSVSGGTLVALAANEAHDVVPKLGSDMILLVHYLKLGPNLGPNLGPKVGDGSHHDD